MLFAIKNKKNFKNLEKLEDLQSKVKQVRLVEKLGKQSSHYDVKEVFEPITKTLTNTSQKLLEGTISNTKAIENLDGLNKYKKNLRVNE